jgi:serine protease Do
MSVRTKDWMKFIGLVGLAFVFGLLFASALDLPKKTAAQPAALFQAAPPPPIPAAGPAAQLGDAFVAVAEHVKPAVVFIRSTVRQTVDNRRLPPGFEDFFPQFKNQRPQIQEGSGSGFIVSRDGFILTNNHVVAGASKVTVRLLDKREFEAHVVGTDPQTDVALIKIDATSLPTVAFGNSDSTRIGEWALAIGNPLGEAFTFTVTAGIVSAKGRLLNGLEQSRYSIQDFIQTDAAINPGNSGGPLVNIRGEVIGINSAIASETGYYAGYGFAIPINLARTVMNQLVATGHVQRAVMGIGINNASQEDAEAVGMKDIHGVVVESFTKDSPAERAGLQLGDVIVELDGQPVDYVAQLQQRVGFKKPGEPVAVTVLRQGGVRKMFNVRLTAQPGDDSGEVATTSSPKSNGDAASTADANRLGIAVTPLTQDDMAQDQLLQRAVLRSGGALVVTDVSPEGPSYRKLSDGPNNTPPDLILRINGTATRSRADFRTVLTSVKAGDIVTVEVLRRTSDGWDTGIVRVRAR